MNISHIKDLEKRIRQIGSRSKNIKFLKYVYLKLLVVPCYRYLKIQIFLHEKQMLTLFNNFFNNSVIFVEL